MRYIPYRIGMLLSGVRHIIGNIDTLIICVGGGRGLGGRGEEIVCGGGEGHVNV